MLFSRQFFTPIQLINTLQTPSKKVPSTLKQQLFTPKLLQTLYLLFFTSKFQREPIFINPDKLFKQEDSIASIRAVVEGLFYL